jgi:hypothetical protein
MKSDAQGVEAKEGAAIICDKKDNVRYAKGAFLGKGGFAKCYEFRNLVGN